MSHYRTPKLVGLLKIEEFFQTSKRFHQQADGEHAEPTAAGQPPEI
jgi:hypothetical protein